MSLKKRKVRHVEVFTHSLNDIMFFLLLFFLIISTLSNPNVIQLRLPKANSTEEVAKQPVTLSITEDKKYFLNTLEIPQAVLEEMLKDATKDQKEPTVVLRLAENLSVQDLVDVMQIGAKLKMKMVLSTEKR